MGKIKFVFFFKFYFELNSRERKPSSMTTPISRPTTVRRPWVEYLKQNRERWIREAGEKEKKNFLNRILVFIISRRRKTSKRIKSYRRRTITYSISTYTYFYSRYANENTAYDVCVCNIY
jgi:hypothetical protein